MRKRGYSDALSTGVLAAGGTLGILIPPSVILVIAFDEQNIVKMFLTAFIPGILAAGIYAAVSVYVDISKSATTSPRVPYSQRFASLLQIWPVVVIFGLSWYCRGLNWSKMACSAFYPDRRGSMGRGRDGPIRLWTGGLIEKALSNASCPLPAHPR